MLSYDGNDCYRKRIRTPELYRDDVYVYILKAKKREKKKNNRYVQLSVVQIHI